MNNENITSLNRIPRKVLLVSSKFAPEYSGSGFRAEQLYRRLGKKFGVYADVLCGSVEFGDNVKFLQNGFSVTRISLAGVLDYKLVSTLRIKKIFAKIIEIAEFFLTIKYLNKKNPSLIHAFGKGSVVSASVYWARVKKKPLILELCNKMDDPHVDVPVLSRIYRPKLDCQTAIVAISKDLADLCNGFGYFENVWHRPNPVRSEIRFVSDIEKKRNSINASDGQDKQVTTLLYIAKFMPQKNQIFLVDVMTHLDDKFELILAGPVAVSGVHASRDQTYLSSVRKKVQSDEVLSKRIHIFSDFVDAAEFFGRSHIYLFPAWNEGLGTPMLEALVAGLPVVANQGEAAFRQWLVDCPTGALCPLDCEPWANSIRNLVATKEITRREVSNRVLSHASEQKIDQTYFRIISRLFESDSRAVLSVKF